MAAGDSSTPLLFNESGKPRSKLVDYGFFAALAIAGFLFYRTVRAVLIPVLLGAFLATLARPWHDTLCRKFRGHRRIAATATTIAVLLLVIVPIALVTWAVVHELASVASTVASKLADEGIAGALDEIPIVRKLRQAFRMTPSDMKQLADTVMAWSAETLKTLLSMASGIIAGAFLLVISLYYFLLDGNRWKKEAERLAPIEPRYVRAFLREFHNVAHALFYGSLVTAAIQGFVSWIGYMIFGVPSPILWGAVTAVMSLTPIIGTAIVWLPLAAILFATGHPVSGIGVAVWGMMVTGSVDNVLRPLLMKGKMRLHPLLVFLSIVGGIAAFGMFGLFAGPLAATLFLTAIRIYDRDYRERLLEPEEEAPLLKPNGDGVKPEDLRPGPV